MLLALFVAQAPALALAQDAAPSSTIVIKSAARPAVPPVQLAPKALPQLSPTTPGSRPLSTPPPAPAPALTGAAPAPAPAVLPWVTLAASAAAGIAGGVFMSRSLAALDEEVQLSAKSQANTLTLPPEYRDQQRRVLTQGIIGTVLISTAVAGSIASLIALAAN